MNLIVDGVNVNASHYAAMKDAEAVKAILADGFAVGETDSEKQKWATDLVPKLRKEVEVQNAKAKAQLQKEKESKANAAKETQEANEVVGEEKSPVKKQP